MAQPPEPASPALVFQRLAEIAVGATARIELSRISAGPSAGGLVVVKRLHPHIADEPQFVDMFRDEAWMTASLKNEHVVQVAGFGADAEGPYLAVEFVRGVSLARLMKTVFETGEVFTERLVVYLGYCICDGLHAAHELRSPAGELLQLVHRDITPGNVLLGFDGQVKIADFGLAKAKQRLTRTLTGLLKGQPYYMSPEQIRSQPVDRRSDVFALGVLLYELFAGRRPWNAASDLDAMRATCEEPPDDLQLVRPRIDKALVAVVGRCLEKEPSSRFQTSGELRDRLLEWLTVHGYRDDNEIAMARFVRRNAMRQMRWFDRAIAGHFAKDAVAAGDFGPAPTVREVPARNDGMPLGARPMPLPLPSQAAIYEMPNLGRAGAGPSVPMLDDGGEWGEEDGPTLIQKSGKARQMLRRLTAGLLGRGRSPAEGGVAAHGRSSSKPPRPEPAAALIGPVPVPVVGRVAGPIAAPDTDSGRITTREEDSDPQFVVRDEPSIPEATTVRRHARAAPEPESTAVTAATPLPSGPREVPAAAPMSVGGAPPAMGSAPVGVVAPPDPDVPPVPSTSDVSSGPRSAASAVPVPIPSQPVSFLVPPPPGLGGGPPGRAMEPTATSPFPDLLRPQTDASWLDNLAAGARQLTTRAEDSTEQARRSAATAQLANHAAALASHAVELARHGRRGEALTHMQEAERIHLAVGRGDLPTPRLPAPAAPQPALELSNEPTFQEPAMHRWQQRVGRLVRRGRSRLEALIAAEGALVVGLVALGGVVLLVVVLLLLVQC
jgi:hypothetical protein